MGNFPPSDNPPEGNPESNLGEQFENSFNHASSVSKEVRALLVQFKKSVREFLKLLKNDYVVVFSDENGTPQVIQHGTSERAAEEVTIMLELAKNISETFTVVKNKTVRVFKILEIISHEPQLNNSKVASLVNTLPNYAWKDVENFIGGEVSQEALNEHLTGEPDVLDEEIKIVEVMNLFPSDDVERFLSEHFGTRNDSGAVMSEEKTPTLGIINVVNNEISSTFTEIVNLKENIRAWERKKLNFNLPQ